MSHLIDALHACDVRRWKCKDGWLLKTRWQNRTRRICSRKERKLNSDFVVDTQWPTTLHSVKQTAYNCVCWILMTWLTFGERLASASKTTEKANTTGCQWLVKCFFVGDKNAINCAKRNYMHMKDILKELWCIHYNLSTFWLMIR